MKPDQSKSFRSLKLFKLVCTVLAGNHFIDMAKILYTIGGQHSSTKQHKISTVLYVLSHLPSPSLTSILLVSFSPDLSLPSMLARGCGGRLGPDIASSGHGVRVKQEWLHAATGHLAPRR